MRSKNIKWKVGDLLVHKNKSFYAIYCGIANDNGESRHLLYYLELDDTVMRTKFVKFFFPESYWKKL